MMWEDFLCRSLASWKDFLANADTGWRRSSALACSRADRKQSGMSGGGLKDEFEFSVVEVRVTASTS